MKASLVRMCASLCLGAAVAWADEAPPAARVQREAENPMRWIVEAGRLKTRPKPAESAASAARAAVDKLPIRSSANKPAVRAASAGSAPVEPDPPTIALAENDPLPTPAAPIAPALERLERIEGEDPALPAEIKRQLQADGEVLLDFTVQPDGSVAELEVLSSSDARLEPLVLEAVRGWRFRPIAQARRQRVQIAFSAQD